MLWRVIHRRKFLLLQCDACTSTFITACLRANLATTRLDAGNPISNLTVPFFWAPATLKMKQTVGFVAKNIVIQHYVL